MTVNISRSQNASLSDGATDGKYRKRRPDTEVIRGLGDEKVQANRDGLNPFYNYGYVNSEAVHKVNPGK